MMDSDSDVPVPQSSSEAETSSSSDVPDIDSSSNDSQDSDLDGMVSASTSTNEVDSEDELDIATTFPSGFAVCARKETKRGITTFEIIGPVLERHVDPWAFTHVISVRAPESLSCREVYACACPRLVKHGMYTSLSAAHLSVRLVGRNVNVEESATNVTEPSWENIDADNMTDRDAHKVLRRAKFFARASSGLNRVLVTSVTGAADHPWRLHAQRARDRRVARHAVGLYRRRVARIVNSDSRVVRAIGAGACGRLRRALELEDGCRDARTRRIKVSHGRSMPKILPGRTAYSSLKRAGVESGTGVPHFLWTMGSSNAVDVWTFVRGTAAAGQRVYSAGDGRRMRLLSGGIKRTLQGVSMEAGAAGNNESVAVVARDDEDLVSDLRAASTSYLVSMDGKERLNVVAVQFDAPTLVQRAIDRGLDPAYTGDPRTASNVITVAADGGPVCRRTLTVVTVTLSSEYLVEKQSPLLPMVYILQGEESLHTSIGQALQQVMKDVLDAHYTVPCVRNIQEISAGAEALTVREIVAVRPAAELRLVGDFSMLHHLLGLTGGSDKLRCPSGWPCTELMHPSDPSWSVTRPRTIDMVLQHWEFSVWCLSRWCALRPRGWVATDGVVGVVCAGCKRLMPYQTESTNYLVCSAAGCSRFGQQQAETLPALPHTVMADALRAARRMFGGVRGPPAVPNVPIVPQDPVLHCTSDIFRKLVHMHMALLTRTEADMARQVVYELEGKTNLGSLYGREFRALVAKIVARPSMLGAPIDPAMLQMLALAQLLAASWRKAVGRGPLSEREPAAAVMELTAKLLAPLFATFKPLDPDTTNRGVNNLYLHTAAAHARSRVGRNAPPVPLVSDDDIEGVIRLTNEYFKTRTSNVSRAEALTDMHALCSFSSAKLAVRFVADAGIYTSTIRVCPCVASLSPLIAADVAVTETLAEQDENLSLSKTLDDNGRTVIAFALPEVVRDTNESILAKAVEDGDVAAMGLERRVALALVEAQRVISLCVCGNLGGVPSRLASKMLATAAAVAAAAAGVPSDEEEPGVSPAVGPVSPSAGALVVEPMRADTDDGGSTTEEADVWCDMSAAPSAITGYIPSAVLRQMVLNADGETGPLPRTTAAALRTEMTMLEMFVRRTHAHSFAQWCVRNNCDVAAIRKAAQSVRAKLTALLARCASLPVRTI